MLEHKSLLAARNGKRITNNQRSLRQHNQRSLHQRTRRKHPLKLFPKRQYIKMHLSVIVLVGLVSDYACYSLHVICQSLNAPLDIADSEYLGHHQLRLTNESGKCCRRRGRQKDDQARRWLSSRSGYSEIPKHEWRTAAEGESRTCSRGNNTRGG